MLIAKKSFEGRAFEIKEEFIDRSEAKDLYKKKLNNNTNPYNIIVYYGIGGIGKSKLRKEISRIHQLENKRALSFCLDFNVAEDRNIGNGILKLVDSCSAKVDFKCFELAYAIYYKKKYPGVSYGREKQLLVEKTTVSFGLNIIGFLFSSITTTVAQVIEKTIRAISKRVMAHEVKEILKEFDNYSLDQMEEWLPTFFSYDLESYLKKHAQTKVLLIFDTFEALNENIIEKIHRDRNERWVQDIVSCFPREKFPNLLITIFGRDSLEWEDPNIEQYELQAFDIVYSGEYLQKAKIDNPEIMENIIRSSGGYPFFLYLSLETYGNIINKGEQPRAEDFRGDYPQIIERFIYNLDKDSVEVLRLMSVPNFYNEEIFEYLIKEFSVSFPITEFEQFNKFSFISCNKQKMNYFVNEKMRTGILDKTSPRIQKAIHEKMLFYYKNLFCAEGRTKDFIELIYHGREVFDAKQFNKWIIEPFGNQENSLFWYMSEMQKSGEQLTLTQIIDGLVKKYNIVDLDIQLFNIYVDIVHLGGDYEVAVSMCDYYLSRFSNEEFKENEQLIKIQVRRLHHCMFFMPVDNLIVAAELLLQNTNIIAFPEVYNEILFLLGGNLGVLSGRFVYAKEWLDKSMSYAKKMRLTFFIYRTIRKQVSILLNLGSPSDALSLLHEYIQPTEEINNRYQIYLMCIMGEVYRKLGEYEKAIECFEIVEKKSIEKNIPGWQAHALLGLGMVEILRQKYTEADTLIHNAQTIYNRKNQAWGKINSQTAELLINKKKYGCVNQELLDRSYQEAVRLNYRYNITYLEMMKKNEEGYFQLFFL